MTTSIKYQSCTYVAGVMQLQEGCLTSYPPVSGCVSNSLSKKKSHEEQLQFEGVLILLFHCSFIYLFFI